MGNVPEMFGRGVSEGPAWDVTPADMRHQLQVKRGEMVMVMVMAMRMECPWQRGDDDVDVVLVVVVQFGMVMVFQVPYSIYCNK